MKIYLILFGIIISSLISSCGKKDAVAPEEPPIDKPGGGDGGTPVSHGFKFDDTFKSTGTFATLIASLPDGKMIIGNTTQIARLNNDGTLDNTFTVGSAGGGEFRTLYLQKDGKVLIGGTFTSYNSQASNYVIRLNADGSIDGSFKSMFSSHQQYSTPNEIWTITVQSDGKIYCGGTFLHVLETTPTGLKGLDGLVRLNADGSYDATFQHKVSAGAIKCVKVATDGKIYVTGVSISIEGQPDYNNILRLNPNGTIDLGFKFSASMFKSTNPSSTNGIGGSGEAIAIQDDGKILLGGRFDKLSSVINENYGGIVRLNANGTIDTTFPRFSYGEIITSIHILSDKVVYTIKNDPLKIHSTANSGVNILNKDWTTPTLIMSSNYSYGDCYNVAEDTNGNLIMVGKLYQVPVPAVVTYRGVVRFNKY